MILKSNKEQTMILVKTWNLRNSMPNKRSQIQKATYMYDSFTELLEKAKLWWNKSDQ